MHKILELLLDFVIAIIVWIGKTECNENISISDSRYLRYSVYWARSVAIKSFPGFLPNYWAVTLDPLKWRSNIFVWHFILILVSSRSVFHFVQFIARPSQGIFIGWVFLGNFIFHDDNDIDIPETLLLYSVKAKSHVVFAVSGRYHESAVTTFIKHPRTLDSFDKKTSMLSSSPEVVTCLNFNPFKRCIFMALGNFISIESRTLSKHDYRVKLSS